MQSRPLVDFIFTLDYEIYGNGEGTLRDLVLEPTRELAGIFREFDAPMVIFAEAVEFARMKEAASDPDIEQVEEQLRELRAAGHEIGLHLHPWWANARYEAGRWRMDWSEKNICTLTGERVDAIVSNAVRYLRESLGDAEYTPFSFRSGLWLMQPTAVIADVLTRHGVQVDSSVFRGGRTQEVGLDYRSIGKRGGSWRFGRDVTTPDPQGALWEMPIHTEMVPFWRMLGAKRLKLHRRVPSNGQGSPTPRRWRDFVRFRYPQKLDFCRMTFEEMRDSTAALLASLRNGGAEPSPVVAIGHSKDFVDGQAMKRFLDFLQGHGGRVTTFARLLRSNSRFCAEAIDAK